EARESLEEVSPSVLQAPFEDAATEPGRLRPVQVTVRSDASMRGARAALGVRRAESLGRVSSLRPALTQFDREAFDGHLAFVLPAEASDEEVVARLRSAGDIESVRFESVAAAEVGAPGPSRQIRVDLRRLDALMNQVGELVVAKNRLAVHAALSGDPTLGELS